MPAQGHCKLGRENLCKQEADRDCLGLIPGRHHHLPACLLG